MRHQARWWGAWAEYNEPVRRVLKTNALTGHEVLCSNPSIIAEGARCCKVQPSKLFFVMNQDLDQRNVARNLVPYYRRQIWHGRVCPMPTTRYVFHCCSKIWPPLWAPSFWTVADTYRAHSWEQDNAASSTNSACFCNIVKPPVPNTTPSDPLLIRCGLHRGCWLP